MEKIIITIDREFGSGGHEVGKLLAKRLNIKFYDDEIIMKAAESTGFNPDYIRFNEEKVPGFSISSFFTGTEMYQGTPYDTIQAEQNRLIKKLAEESCVIVGRAADYILQDEVHVSMFIFAPLESRLKRILAKKRVYHMPSDFTVQNDTDMLKFIKQCDKQRRKYYEFYTENKWGDRDCYDLLINTDRTGIVGAADIIEEYINKCRGKDLMTDIDLDI